MGKDETKSGNYFKRFKNAVYEKKRPITAFWTAVGSNIIDIPAMLSVPNDYWPKFISSGQYYAYLTAFSAAKFLPSIYYGTRYLISKHYKKDLDESERYKKDFLDCTEVGLWANGAQDFVFYGIRGMNPISPNPEKPYYLPFAWFDEHVAEFIGRNVAVAGAFSAIKRRFFTKSKPEVTEDKILEELKS